MDKHERLRALGRSYAEVHGKAVRAGGCKKQLGEIEHAYRVVRREIIKGKG